MKHKGVALGTEGGHRRSGMSVLELQRRTHEDIERMQHAASQLLSEEYTGVCVLYYHEGRLINSNDKIC